MAVARLAITAITSRDAIWPRGSMAMRQRTIIATAEMQRDSATIVATAAIRQFRDDEVATRGNKIQAI